MTALIIIFITLSLMGSVLWILPSKRERQRMNLRMYARKLDFTVQLTSIDLPDKWDKSMNSHKTVSYSLYRIKSVPSLPDAIWLLPYDVWKYHVVTEGWWSSETVVLTEEIIEILKKHGAVLLGIKITPDSVSFYWNELGDEVILNKLFKVMHFLADIR